MALPALAPAHSALRHGANSFLISSQARLEPGATRLAFTSYALNTAQDLLTAKLPRPPRRARAVSPTGAFGGLADR